MASSLQNLDPNPNEWARVNVGNADPALAFSDALSPGAAAIDATERARSQGASPERSPTERDPLLPKSVRKGVDEEDEDKSWFWKAGRHWLIPFWLLASFARGMTLAPRVEIYTNLACEAYLPDHAHHTHHPSNPNSTYVEVLPLTPPSFYSASWTSPEDLFSPNSFTWSTFSKGDKHHEIPDGEDEAIGELPKQRCFKDPVVQQAAAKLQMTVILTMGVLSAATTGWWGSVGDRIGRTKILALSLMGYLFTDFMFIMMAMYAKALAPWGGHRLLLLGPIVEGLLGGWATATAAVNSYVSDITPHGSRSHSFSTFQGILFIGVACGPAFGSLILKFTDEILLVFFTSVCISLLNAMLAAFIMPESLSKDARLANREAFSTRASCDVSVEDDERNGFFQSLGAKFATLFSALEFFRPRGSDWRLTFIAVAWFSVMLTVGVYPLKLLYAEHMFSWTAVELGNFLSFIGAARALHLLVTLPLARISLVLDILSYTAVSLTSSPKAFLLATGLSSFAGGVSPAIQSLSMMLLPNPRDDTGKMFGALSMLQAISATIVSPLFFGLLYSNTVEKFPTGIWVCGAALVTVAFVAMLLVRPHKHHNKKIARGRSTRIKRLSGSAPGTREGSLASTSTRV